MVDDVQFKRLEAALTKRRESHPNEDVEISFKMACSELGIINKDVRKQIWVRVANSGSLSLIGEWQSRRHRPHFVDAREDLNEENRQGFPRPGAA